MRRINKKGNQLIERIIEKTEGEVDIYYKKGLLILENSGYGNKEYFRINNNKDYKKVVELIFGEL